MDNTRIYVTSFGSFNINWTDPNVHEPIGLVTAFHPRVFEIIDERLFNYNVIKHEIQYELISEHKRNVLAKVLKP